MERETGGLPRRFQTAETFGAAVSSVLDDSYTRTGSFDEAAEVISDLFMGIETKMDNYRRSLNGKF